MRWTGIVRILVLVITLILVWYIAESIFSRTDGYKSLKSIFDMKKTQPKKKVGNYCGNEKKCPYGHFAFKIISGAANVVGPSICFEDNILMSSIKNNIGRGLNFALVNGSNGTLIRTNAFDMYSGDVKPLLEFLNSVEDGTLVFLASYDDPATKLNEEARIILTSFGSSHAKKVGFRDSWVFVGAKGLKAHSPFEEVIKNSKDTNKYDGWPEMLEIEGCIPRKVNEGHSV